LNIYILIGSGKPFIWVLRPPTGFDINGEFKEEWLPEGFEKRMNQKGSKRDEKKITKILFTVRGVGYRKKGEE
jgi:hypothetical protein